MSCVFCEKGASETGEIVFEDERAWIVLHHDWSVVGHAMVVAKRHVENPSGLDEDGWLHLARLWHRAEGILRELTKADRVVALKLGIQTPHLHVHLYPVSARATREQVFAIVDMKTHAERDPGFVEQLRGLLTAARD